MDSQRRLSKAERAEQSANFLNFKNKMKFKTVNRFHEHYQLMKELGAGAFGTVKIGKHRKTQMPCAIKIIKKESLKVHEIYEELNKNELEVLEVTQHPNITRIFELMEDKHYYYIVMEIITGGNLLQVIGKMKWFTEQQAAKVIKQLLLALNFMHQKNIMHRDLKPENILVEENADDVNNNDIYIKLTDFGFATKYDSNKKQTLSLGSPLYMAPELCKEIAYDNKVDVWAVGVITYILLSGSPPFYDRKRTNTKQAIYNDIIKNEPDYSLLKTDSSLAEEFIRTALMKSGSKRASIEQMLNHEWIKKNEGDNSISQDKQLDLSKNLAAFAKTSNFQSGICSILANLMTKTTDLKELNKMFVQWDTSQDGQLSYEELKENMAEISTLFQMDAPDVENLMRAADTNRDGQVDYTEFITAAFDKQKLLS